MAADRRRYRLSGRAALRSEPGQRHRPDRLGGHVRHLARHPPALPGGLRRLPTRRNASMDSAVGHQLRHRRGRHLALAGPADDAPYAGRPALLVEFDSQTPEGVRHRHARARVGDDRSVRLAGHPPLLRLLRADAPADVPDHRRMGRREPHLRRGEVLPLHHRRLAAHAPRHHLSGVPGAAPDGADQLRHHRPL